MFPPNITPKILDRDVLTSHMARALLTDHLGLISKNQLRHWANLGYVTEATTRVNGRQKRRYAIDQVTKLYFIGILVNYLGFESGSAASIAEKFMRQGVESNGRTWITHKEVQLGVIPLRKAMEALNGDTSH